jgi:hypothetical protein
LQDGLRELETALNNYLGWAGELIPDEEDRGPGWFINLLLYKDVDIENWVQRLVRFLRLWGVPDGTSLSFITYPRDSGSGIQHGRVEVSRR